MKTHSHLYGLDRARQRFAALAQTSHWPALEVAWEAAWEHVGNWNEPWREVHALCVSLSRMLGLPIGPRCCQDCCAILVLDEDGDGLDPKECPDCERDEWLSDWHEAQRELAHRLFLGSMTHEERWAYLLRQSVYTYYVGGLVNRCVQ